MGPSPCAASAPDPVPAAHRTPRRCERCAVHHPGHSAPPTVGTRGSAWEPQSWWGQWEGVCHTARWGWGEDKGSEDTCSTAVMGGRDMGSRSGQLPLVLPPSVSFKPWVQLLPAPPPEGMSPTSDLQFPVLCSAGSLRQTDKQSVSAWGSDQIPGNEGRGSYELQWRT